MTRIGIIVGSTRPHRHAHDVAGWALQLASLRGDATYEIVDLRDHPLPLLDEPMPPSMGHYQHEHTRRWAATVAGFDGFVIVTPEYNHSVPAVLKNALDYLYAEWNHKAIGFISYGTHGGVRAVEHLRAIAGELMMADVRAQVVLPFATDFENHRIFTPREHASRVLGVMLDQVVAWSEALAPLRRRAEAERRARAAAPDA
ncbi:NADPH-dependent FMN reductase [Raineyella fluvialis]|uniref:NADPH-dependent FMN reductase n=1 Tax=Raineyella fluvialis TaxID=2662261 RepID=A0A5Q2FC56_9ACTN|nr:NADPH-dependent FMN reductase [Raineyella fluvialis]